MESSSSKVFLLHYYYFFFHLNIELKLDLLSYWNISYGKIWDSRSSCGFFFFEKFIRKLATGVENEELLN